MFLQEGNELTAWPEERSAVYHLNLSKCNSTNLFQEYFKAKMIMKYFTGIEKSNLKFEEEDMIGHNLVGQFCPGYVGNIEATVSSSYFVT